MLKIVAFTLLLAIPTVIFTQENVTQDTVPFDFWGSTLWQLDNSVDQIRDPQDNSLIAVRKYYTNSRISEEYLRLNDTTWLFQHYDSLEPTRFVERGLYISDPEFGPVDTILNFDPTTYEEDIHVRLSRYGFKSGPWLERDENGYIWTGNYEDDLREGLWQKRDAYDYTELRGFLYEGGDLVRDSILNWALSTDTSKIVGLLSEGVVPGQRGGIVSENTPGGFWRLCSVGPDAFGKNQIWKFTHLDYLPGQCTNDSWGSYLFLENRSLLYVVNTPNGPARDEGRWELLDGNKLLLSLKKQGDKRLQMKFLCDGELILQELSF